MNHEYTGKKSESASEPEDPEEKTPVSHPDQEPQDENSDHHLPIVGVGASAGGLKALKQFFSLVPSDTGIAFVVVMHLSSDHESHLAELLQPHVQMPVSQVTQTVPLQPNHVYVIPPNANLDTIDTHLRLSELEKPGQGRAPIDHFFRTLAKTHDGEAIGVVLTGTGSDGTLGLREIKERGGLTIVQDPDEAEYDGMPRSAIVAGMTDVVLPLEKIPEQIVQYTQTRPKLPSTSDEGEQTEADWLQVLQKIFAQLRARTGRDFSRYKRSTILRRIQRRMQLRQMEDFASYLELLREQPEETRRLADDLLITVTSFFRDEEVFKKLESEVIGELFAGKEEKDEIRIWSVGCATGEEAYSLAMLLLEEAGRREILPRIQIFASDLHEHSLKRAREGYYPGDIDTDVSPERLKRFFVKEDSGYRIRKEVRELVIFAPHNLFVDPPFSRIDLISCRNVLIYIQRNVQRDIIELFHYALRPNGYLVLGTSETVEGSELFRLEDKKRCMYRKLNVPAPEPRLPVFPLLRSPLHIPSPHLDQGGEPLAMGALHQKMVERYAPPSALVSPDDKIVHLSEHAGRFLQHPGGELTNNIYKLVRDELRIELRTLLHGAREAKIYKHSPPVVVRFNGESAPVVLHARPAMDKDHAGYVLVIFDERSEEHAPESPVESASSIAQPATNGQAAARERELEAELDQVKQRLQAIIEEYETSQEEMKAANEEMQSTNEELRSTLEELETSKEELQSMNEELQTVNQENRHKVDELAQLSSDLQNLLAATDIATLFLDREFRILRFTPKVSELFNVRVNDRSRPISDFTHHLGYPELHEDARRVLEKLIPIEREVEDKSGRWYLTRVMPYRSTADRIEGIVITFVEITARRSAEQALRESQQRLSEELAAMTKLHDLVSRLLICSDLKSALSEVLNASMDLTVAGKGIVQLFNPELEELEIVAHRGFSNEMVKRFRKIQRDEKWSCMQAAQLGERVAIMDVTSDPDQQHYSEVAAEAGFRSVQSTPLLSRNGEMLGVLSIYHEQPYQPLDRNIEILDLYARQAADCIESVRNTENAKVANRRKDEFLATLAHELRNPLAPIRTGLDLLKRSDDKLAVLQEIQGTLDRQTLQLVRLVEDLLDVSRISRGKLELKCKPMLLRDIVDSALEEAQAGLQSALQKVEISLPEPPVWLDADPQRVTQILSNLLNNAAKYTPDQGRIWLTARQQENQLVITVKDTGIGIPAEKLESIFEIFSQVNQESESAGGIGIGLALVKTLVELHHGTIEVKSEGPGQGSEFIVRLPVIMEHPPEQGEIVEAEIVEENNPSRRVLIVDDNHSAAKMLGLLIKSYGHEVQLAHDGEEAFAVAAEYQPEVIFMDLGMPRLNGVEAAKRIRQQDWGRNITLVALSGWTQDKDREETKQAGFNLHLGKPVETDELLEIFASLNGNSSE